MTQWLPKKLRLCKKFFFNGETDTLPPRKIYSFEITRNETVIFQRVPIFFPHTSSCVSHFVLFLRRVSASSEK